MENNNDNIDSQRIKEGVGGQAVIEGIMLRDKTHYVVAVRKPDKTLDYIKNEVPENKSTFKNVMFIRGVVNFVSMMKLGYKTLVFSANTAMPENEKKEQATPLAMSLAMITSLGIAVALFTALPYVITNLFGIDEKSHVVLFNLVRGLVKVGIFVAYLLIISTLKDIKEIFQYHGAEHMVVNAYEHGLNPNKENIRTFTTIHPRCGTTFLFLVITISVVLYMFTSYFVYNVIYANFIPPKIIANITVLAINILLLPLVSGISYELLRLGFKLYSYPIARIFIIPGLLLQYITTKKPSDDKLEVALFALEKLKDKNISIRTEEEVFSSL